LNLHACGKLVNHLGRFFYAAVACQVCGKTNELTTMQDVKNGERFRLSMS